MDGVYNLFIKYIILYCNYIINNYAFLKQK